MRGGAGQRRDSPRRRQSCVSGWWPSRVPRSSMRSSRFSRLSRLSPLVAASLPALPWVSSSSSLSWPDPEDGRHGPGPCRAPRPRRPQPGAEESASCRWLSLTRMRWWVERKGESSRQSHEASDNLAGERHRLLYLPPSTARPTQSCAIRDANPFPDINKGCKGRNEGQTKDRSVETRSRLPTKAATRVAVFAPSASNDPLFLAAPQHPLPDWPTQAMASQGSAAAIAVVRDLARCSRR